MASKSETYQSQSVNQFITKDKGGAPNKQNLGARIKESYHHLIQLQKEFVSFKERARRSGYSGADYVDIHANTTVTVGKNDYYTFASPVRVNVTLFNLMEDQLEKLVDLLHYKPKRKSYSVSLCFLNDAGFNFARDVMASQRIQQDFGNVTSQILPASTNEQLGQGGYPEVSRIMARSAFSTLIHLHLNLHNDVKYGSYERVTPELYQYFGEAIEEVANKNENSFQQARADYIRSLTAVNYSEQAAVQLVDNLRSLIQRHIFSNDDNEKKELDCDIRARVTNTGTDPKNKDTPYANFKEAINQLVVRGEDGNTYIATTHIMTIASKLCYGRKDMNIIHQYFPNFTNQVNQYFVQVPDDKRELYNNLVQNIPDKANLLSQGNPANLFQQVMQYSGDPAMFSNFLGYYNNKLISSLNAAYSKAKTDRKSTTCPLDPPVESTPSGTQYNVPTAQQQQQQAQPLPPGPQQPQPTGTPPPQVQPTGGGGGPPSGGGSSQGGTSPRRAPPGSPNGR